MTLEGYWSSKMMLYGFIQLDLALGENWGFWDAQKRAKTFEMYYGENDLIVQMNDTKSWRSMILDDIKMVLCSLIGVIEDELATIGLI